MFRRRLPQALRAYFQNRQELRKSLQTYRRAVALRRARTLAAKLDELADLVEEIDDLEFANEENKGRIDELVAAINELYQTERQPFEEQALALMERLEREPSTGAELDDADGEPPHSKSLK